MDEDEMVIKNNNGKILYAYCDVILDETTIVQPDLMFITTENKDIVTVKNIQGASD